MDVSTTENRVGVTLQNAENFNVSCNDITTTWQIDGTRDNLLQWYSDNYPTWFHYYVPYYPAWSQTVYVDATEKAMEVVKELMSKKLLNVKTVKDFIDIVDIIRKKI